MFFVCLVHNDGLPILFQALSSPVLSSVGERYYKVTAEALRVCGELVRVIRPDFEVRLPLVFLTENITIYYIGLWCVCTYIHICICRERDCPIIF